MARIRTTKPEFWDDDIVGSLSRDARLLFMATWNFADDEGLVRWSPEYLRGAAFRYDEDVTQDHVAEWMREIEAAGFTYVYSTSRARHRVGFIVNFRRHQRIDKPQPARLPVPNWRDRAVVMVYARRDGFVCRHCNEAVNEQFAADPAQRRYDPVCERIRPPSERLANPDDPSNIAVVHAMCAKGYDPDAAPDETTPSVPRKIADHSQNVPGTFQERSGDPSGAPSAIMDIPAPDAGSEPAGNHESAGQTVPGTFLERSALDQGSGIRDQGTGNRNTTAPAALFDAGTAVAGGAAGKPQPEAQKSPASKYGSSKSGKRSASEQGTRVPEDFALTDDMRTWGRAHCPHIADPETATDEFVDYWRGVPGAKGKKLDWVGTWRNRMRELERRAVERLPAPRAAGLPSQRSSADTRVSATTRATEHGLDLIRQVAERDGVDLATILPFAPRGELSA